MNYLTFIKKSTLSAVILCLCMNNLHAEDSIVLENKFNDVIEHASRRHSVDANLIRAVIWKESTFNKMAVGDAGEVGLMQIMPAAVADWAKAYKVRVPTKRLLFDPAVNVEVGTWYLARALRQWNQYKYSEALALCEYNAGRRGMSKWVPATLDGLVDIKGRVTYNYVTNILERYVYYRTSREPQRKIAYINSRIN